MDDDELLERAAEILKQRGYPKAALVVLEAIGKAEGLYVLYGEILKDT